MAFDDNFPCVMAQAHDSRPHHTPSSVNSSAGKRASKSISTSGSTLLAAESYHHSPDTNPRQTAHLWETVMAYQGGGVPITPCTTAPSTTSVPTGSSGKEPGAEVTDEDFLESVLKPHKITILPTGVCPDLRQHFHIVGFPDDANIRVQVYKARLSGHAAWMDPETVRFLRQAYELMKWNHVSKAEQATFALRYILRSQILYQQLGKQRWVPYQTIQLFRKPNQDDNWLSPPMMGDRSIKRYDWEVRPDYTYHISTEVFQYGFRTQIRGFTSVVHNRGIYPYLTIGFQEDEEDVKTACYQVAASSATSLYNRYRLKCDMRAATRKDPDNWSEEDKDHMRHYGVTVTGSVWKLWCVRPKTFLEWTGCTMTPMCAGDCFQDPDVQALLTLVNDVHYWGLGVHGESCKADIYRIQGSVHDS